MAYTREDLVDLISINNVMGPMTVEECVKAYVRMNIIFGYKDDATRHIAARSIVKHEYPLKSTFVRVQEAS